MSAHEHHQEPRRSLKIGIITASDTRTSGDDESGNIIRTAEPDRIAAAVIARIGDLDAMIINGGTGISPRDATFEAVKRLLDKELEGFGELFRMLSYNQIGSAAFLSRATAGVCRGKILVSIPG
jgi:molybdenum cofactor biosynthesis protein B